MTQPKDKKDTSTSDQDTVAKLQSVPLGLELELDSILDQGIASLGQKSPLDLLDSILSPSLQVTDSGGRSILDVTQPMESVPTPPTSDTQPLEPAPTSNTLPLEPALTPNTQVMVSVSQETASSPPFQTEPMELKDTQKVIKEFQQETNDFATTQPFEAVPSQATEAVQTKVAPLPVELTPSQELEAWHAESEHLPIIEGEPIDLTPSQELEAWQAESGSAQSIGATTAPPRLEFKTDPDPLSQTQPFAPTPKDTSPQEPSLTSLPESSSSQDLPFAPAEGQDAAPEPDSRPELPATLASPPEPPVVTDSAAELPTATANAPETSPQTPPLPAGNDDAAATMQLSLEDIIHAAEARTAGTEQDPGATIQLGLPDIVQAVQARQEQVQEQVDGDTTDASLPTPAPLPQPTQEEQEEQEEQEAQEKVPTERNEVRHTLSWDSRELEAAATESPPAEEPEPTRHPPTETEAPASFVDLSEISPAQSPAPSSSTDLPETSGEVAAPLSGSSNAVEVEESPQGKNKQFAQTMLYGSEITTASIQQAAAEIQRARQEEEQLTPGQGAAVLSTTLETESHELSDVGSFGVERVDPSTTLETESRELPATLASASPSDTLAEEALAKDEKETLRDGEVSPSPTPPSTVKSVAHITMEDFAPPPTVPETTAKREEASAQTIAYGGEELNQALQQALAQSRQRAEAQPAEAESSENMEESAREKPATSRDLLRKKGGAHLVRDTAVDLDLLDPENQPRPTFAIAVEPGPAHSSHPTAPIPPRKSAQEFGPPMADFSTLSQPTMPKAPSSPGSKLMLVMIVVIIILLGALGWVLFLK